MTTNHVFLNRLRDEITIDGLSRRDVLRRGLALGLTAPVIAGLLAACGGDDDDGESSTATATTGAAAQATATTEGPTETAEVPMGQLTATAQAAQPTAPPEPTATPDTAVQRGGGGKLTMLLWQAPTILNLHVGQGGKDTTATRVCQEPLFEFDANNNPIMVLAVEYPTVENGLLSPDGTFVIWNLRQGVKWHDGEDFNAEDVKFTWEWITHPDASTTTSATYANVDSIDILDDYTVQVNFKSPDPAWFDPFRASPGVILPEHIFRDYLGEAGREAPANLAPIGTGPFKVVDFNPGDVVLYEIFDDYWDPGKPFFDSVELKGGGDATSAARAVLVTGEADYAWNLQVEPEILNQMESEGGQGALVSIPGNSAERIYVNFADPNSEVDGARAEPTTEHPIWKHKEAREALNFAIQRDVIATQLYGAAGVATGDNMNVPARFKLNLPWEFDLDKAKEKLAAINFPDDFASTNIVYQTSVNSVRQKNQEIVKADLEQLGFSVELKSVDSGVFFSSDAGNPDTYAHFYTDIEMYTNGPGSPYPIAWASRYRSDEIAEKSNDWSGVNITRWNNPEFDALHEQAKAEIDEDVQLELWTAMMTMVADDIVEVPIVWRGGAEAVSSRIDESFIGPQVSNWATWPSYDLKNWKLKE